MKLKLRFLIFLGILPIPALGIVAFLDYRSEVRLERDMALKELENAASNLAAELYTFLPPMGQFLRNLGYSKEVQDLLTRVPKVADRDAVRASPEWGPYKKLLSGKLHTFPGLLSIYSGTFRNRLAMSLGSMNYAESYVASQRYWYVGAVSRGSLYVSPPEWSGTQGEQSSTQISLSVPVRGGKGNQIIGVMALDISLEYIWRVLRGSFSSYGSRGWLDATVVDRVSRRILASTVLDQHTTAEVPSFDRLLEFMKEESAEKVNKAIVSKEGHVIGSADGKQVSYVLYQIPLTDWVTLVRFDRATIMREAERKAIVRVCILVVPMFLLFWVVLFFFRKTTIRTLSDVTTQIRKVIKGEKILKIKVPSRENDKNEINQFAILFNRFISKIHEFFYSITRKDVSGKIDQTELKVVVNEAANSVGRIAEELLSTTENTSKFKICFDDSLQVSKKIFKEISSVSQLLHSQNQTIVNTIKSVKNLLSQTEGISALAREKKVLTIALSESARKGKELIEATNQSMEQGVVKRVGGIQEMAESIQKISAQTNLLSMNAAIEAAYAGSGGRGFSIVAEEVRKLADMSRESSQRITEITYEITESISETFENAILTSREFDFIVQEIQSAIEEFDRVSLRVKDINEKGVRMLKDLLKLKEALQEVRKGAHEVESVDDELLKVHTQVEKDLEGVQGDIGEISSNAEKIGVVVEQVQSLGKELLNIEMDIEKSSSKFQVEEHVL